MVIDFRVMAYHVYDYWKKVREIHQEPDKTWLAAAWGFSINRGYTGEEWEPHTVVVVDDRNLNGEYWRHKYLRDRGYPEYKAGRSAKGPDWYEVAQAGVNYLTSKGCNIDFLGFEGFEADDVAGAIVRLSKGERHIKLHTIDSDWCGLINDHVTWYDMAQWAPRVRDFDGFMEWVRRKGKAFKHPIHKPTDLWVEKSINGDSSDNLPKNSPLEVIDLLNPPKEHDILKVPQAKRLIKAAMLKEVENANWEHCYRSQCWLQKEGYPLPAFGANLFPLKGVEG